MNKYLEKIASQSRKHKEQKRPPISHLRAASRGLVEGLSSHSSGGTAGDIVEILGGKRRGKQARAIAGVYNGARTSVRNQREESRKK